MKPSGSNTFHEYRQQRLTLSGYLSLRLLNADGRFAQNLDYVFYAQYLSEVQQVVSNVSVALRKGKAGFRCEKIDADVLNNEEALKKTAAV